MSLQSPVAEVDFGVDPLPSQMFTGWQNPRTVPFTRRTHDWPMRSLFFSLIILSLATLSSWFCYQSQRIPPSSLQSAYARGFAAGCAIDEESPESVLDIRPEMPSWLRPMIAHAARTYRLDPHFVAAVIEQESAFDPKATSVCGAQGLMQLMPETSRELGIHNPYDPWQNVNGGCKLLRRCLDQFQGDQLLALCAFLCGPESVQQHGGVPPYSEAHRYVRRVLTLYRANCDVEFERTGS